MSLIAADDAWQSKRVSEWSDDDAKQVLTHSPWVKEVTPTVTRSNEGERGMHQSRGGIGIGGVGIGLPGAGRRGGGYPGGGYPGGGQRPSRDGEARQAPTLTLRWESALPVREAELKTKVTSAPSVDEDHYAIAVYGVPIRTAGVDSNQLKKQASLKREGQKDIKPSSVEVLEGEDGEVILYLFPRSKEITKNDKRVEFDAQVGRMQLRQPFYVEDMVYLGKLEL